EALKEPHHRQLFLLTPSVVAARAVLHDLDHDWKEKSSYPAFASLELDRRGFAALGHPGLDGAHLKDTDRFQPDEAGVLQARPVFYSLQKADRFVDAQTDRSLTVLTNFEFRARFQQCASLEEWQPAIGSPGRSRHCRVVFHDLKTESGA